MFQIEECSTMMCSIVLAMFLWSLDVSGSIERCPIAQITLTTEKYRELLQDSVHITEISSINCIYHCVKNSSLTMMAIYSDLRSSCICVYEKVEHIAGGVVKVHAVDLNRKIGMLINMSKK